ncbi:hypothetical protein LXL04_011491 [Taraxacum kok-saghyz]
MPSTLTGDDEEIVFVYLSGSADMARRFRNESRRRCSDSDPTEVLSDWKAATAACSWRGVVCSKEDRVTAVNLTGDYLTGTLDVSELMLITTLTDIYFAGNYFFGNLSFSSNSCSFQRNLRSHFKPQRNLRSHFKPQRNL